jgi:hypothetical protein
VEHPLRQINFFNNSHLFNSFMLEQISIINIRIFIPFMPFTPSLLNQKK